MTLKYLANKASGSGPQFRQELIIELLNTEVIALHIFFRILY